MNDIVANRFFRRDEVVVGPVNVVTHAGSLTRSKAKEFKAFKEVKKFRERGSCEVGREVSGKF